MSGMLIGPRIHSTGVMLVSSDDMADAERLDSRGRDVLSLGVSFAFDLPSDFEAVVVL